mgnify:CR=1 FL=1
MHWIDTDRLSICTKQNAQGHRCIILVSTFLVCTFLVFRIALAMRLDLLPAAICALLFGVHPMRVESVAWITERKDVLSTLFWMLTTWCYLRYVERPGMARYGMALAAFAAGLLAKPMLVTVPFTLLLLDYWPLGRLGSRRQLRRALLEKLPLLLPVA